MLYSPIKVEVPSRYHEKIKKAVVKGEAKSPVSVKINFLTLYLQEIIYGTQST